MGKQRDSAAPGSPNGSGSDDEVADFGNEEPSEDEETIEEHEEPNEEEPCKEEPDEEESRKEGPDEVAYEEEVIEEETCEEELDDERERAQTEEEKCEEEPVEDVCREEANEEETSQQEPNEEVACVEDQTDEQTCEEEPKVEEACEEEQAEERACEEEPNEEKASEEVRTEEKTSVEELNEEETCEEEPTEEEIVEEPHVEHRSEASADQSPSESDTDEKHHPNSTPILPEEKKRSADALENHFQKRHKQEMDSELKSCARSLLPESKDEIASKKIDNSGSSGKRRRTSCDADHEADGEESDDAVKKKRKIKWESDDALLKMLGPLKLPEFVEDLVDDTEFDPEIKKLNSELLEVSRKLQAQEFVDDLPVDERSPSPPPIYNEFGVRLNTREARYHVKLVERRQKIISDLVQKYPTFKPPSDYRPPKLYKKLYIPAKEYPGYNFIGLIIGPRGNTQKQMEKETGARILIRGKGSLKDERLSKDPNPDPAGDYEDLHVRVEAESESSLDAAVKMVEKLLVPVEDGLNVLKHAQLRELAKLRAEDLERIPRKCCEVHLSCSICGNFDHLAYACPLRASTLISTNGRQSDFLAEIGAGDMPPFSGPPVHSSVMSVPWMACPASSSSSGKHSGKTHSELDENNLYIGFLPQTVNDYRLIDLFSPFGTICSACVIKDKATGLSKGYGFVRYNNPESASKAIARMNGYKIDGKMLAVRVKGPPPSTGSITKELEAVPGFTHLPACPGPQAIARLNPDPMVWPGSRGSLLPEAYPSLPSLVHINAVGGQPPASFGYPGQTANFPSLASSESESASELTQFPGNLKSFDVEDHLTQPTPFTSFSSQLGRATQAYGVRRSFMHSHEKLPF